MLFVRESVVLQSNNACIVNTPFSSEQTLLWVYLSLFIVQKYHNFAIILSCFAIINRCMSITIAKKRTDAYRTCVVSLLSRVSIAVADAIALTMAWRKAAGGSSKWSTGTSRPSMLEVLTRGGQLSTRLSPFETRGMLNSCDGDLHIGTAAFLWVLSGWFKWSVTDWYMTYLWRTEGW